MKVLIADDHSLIRSAMKVLMESNGYEVVAEAANEHHDYAKEKKGKTKTTTQSDQVTQQSAAERRWRPGCCRGH